MHFRNSKTSRRDRGFSLMEILVVLAIIGLLAGVTMNTVGGFLDNAKIDTAGLFVNTTVKAPMLSYQMHMGDYPSTQEGLQALVTAPAERSMRWRGPYLERLPLDPWNQPYQYASPGTHNKRGYDLWSKGPDKENGTADDIGNWDTSAAASQQQ